MQFVELYIKSNLQIIIIWEVCTLPLINKPKCARSVSLKFKNNIVFPPSYVLPYVLPTHQKILLATIIIVYIMQMTCSAAYSCTVFCSYNVS